MAAIITTVGWRQFLENLRKNRHRYRQFLGIMLLILFTILGAPTLGWMYAAGATLAGLGIATRLWASGHVKKDKVLATTGPYAFVRHPLYVGNHLIMFGFSFASGLWWSFVVTVLFCLWAYPQTIRHEDRQLRMLFPDQWERWAGRTRALIPRLTPYASDERGEWSFRQSLRANGEPVIAALLALCLFFLYARLP